MAPRLAGVRQLFHLRSASSTQTLARALAEAGSPSGTLVWADRQTAGRGRLDRRWASPPGGLYATLILRPRLSPDRLAELSVSAAAAVVRALEPLGVECSVKAPNDVLARRPGSRSRPRKICGILAEAASRGGRTEWILLGLGVNVNNRPPAGLGAASLKGLTGRPYDVEDVLARALRELAAEGRRLARRGRRHV